MVTGGGQAVDELRLGWTPKLHKTVITVWAQEVLAAPNPGGIATLATGLSYCKSG